MYFHAARAHRDGGRVASHAARAVQNPAHQGRVDLASEALGCRAARNLDDDRAVGGLGLYFVRKLMDHVDYEHVNGQNRVTLIKNTAT